MECSSSCDAFADFASRNVWSDEGEDVSAYSNIESDIRSTSAQRRPRTHRPRRTAAERRAQQKRSYARMVGKLLQGFLSIDTHRGNTLGRVGKTVAEVLQRPMGDDNRYHGYRYRPNLCRHYAIGRCTWGAECRFSHDAVDGNDPWPARSGAEDPIKNDHDHDSEADANDEERASFAEAYECASDSEDGQDDNARHGDASSDLTRDYVDQPEFFHLAACKRTRNMLVLFSEAAEAFIARHDVADDKNVLYETTGRIDDSSDERNYDGNQAMIDIHEFLSRFGDVGQGSDVIEQAIEQLPPSLKKDYIEWRSLLADNIADASDSAAPGVDQGDSHSSATVDTVEYYDISEWNEVLYVHNMNQKVAARDMQTYNARRFNRATVETLLRHILSQTGDTPIILVRQLPYDLAAHPLERNAIRYGFFIYDREGNRDADVTIALTLNHYKNKVARILSLSGKTQE